MRFAQAFCLLVAASGSLVLAGCGEGSPPEPTASIEAANTEATKWTPEQKEKFREAMKDHALTAKGPSSDALGKK